MKCWGVVITNNILLVSLIIRGHVVRYNGAQSVGVSWSSLVYLLYICIKCPLKELLDGN